MRRLVSVVAAWVAALAVAQTPAAAQTATGAGCAGTFGGPTCGQTAVKTTSGYSSPRGAVDPDYVSFPWLVHSGEPGTCAAFAENHCSPNGLDLPPGTPDCIKAWGFGSQPQLKSEAQQQWQEALAEHSLCPAATEAGIDPVALAIQAWQHVPLPEPSPHIAPGWMITAKYAYLETNGELRHTYTTGTPLGTLTLEATGRYYVDWGDGTRDGPYAVEGGPWPDGQITHTYIDVGFYDVVVTEEWTANWRVAEFGGTLAGMRTEGRIPNFRVEQIQAVVGR